MHKVFIYVISALILFFPNKIKAFEGKTAKNFMGLYELKQGILAHDRGWFGTNREGFGPDYNFELMFNSPSFLDKVWSPKPILGLTQTSTGAVGKVVEYDSTNKILYYYQTRFPDVGTDSNGNQTAFSGANAITGQSSSASATPNTSNSTTTNGTVFSSGYSNPELAFDSGDVLYVEERSPITRASDQTENIKLIIEF